MKSVTKRYWIAVVLASSSLATLLRLVVHPALGERGVFLLPLLAAAISALLAGTLAGLVTTLLALPAAAILFQGGPGADPLSRSAWLNVGLALVLAVPLCLLSGRFHRLVRDLEQSVRREHEAREEAERANRMRDEFLAVLSHELRSPLTAIVGWTELLKARGLTPDDDEVAATILRHAEHQARLIAEIADVSRGLHGKLVLEKHPVDLCALLVEVVAAVRLSVGDRAFDLQVLVPEAPLTVCGDAARLRQVFWNLLSNGIKFSSSGDAVHVSAAGEDGSAVVRVMDGGQGISADFLPQVFDRFRQEDPARARQHGGLGLGLAIVRHLTEAHGGTVRVESDGPGTGSTFTVTLPIDATAAERQGPSTPQLRGPEAAGH